MNGERCKMFLRRLDVCKLQDIKVKIKRPNIPPLDYPQPIYRGLDDPKSLKVHFEKESLRGIFDRTDIVINQEDLEDSISARQRSRSNDRSLSSDRNFRKEKYSREQSKDDAKYYCRSRSRSGDSYQMDSTRHRRDRSQSPSYRKHSPSPKATSSRNYSTHKRKSSRSYSPNSVPVKKPGLYIPPKSDYLRYEKLNTERSDRTRSPELSHRTKFEKDKKCPTVSKERRRSKSPYGEHASTLKQYLRSRYREQSRSRSLSLEKSRRKARQRTSSRSPEKIRSRKRFDEENSYKFRDESSTNSRLRSPFRTRPSRRSRSPYDKRHSPRRREDHSRSPRRDKEYSRRRSRSRSKDRDRMMKDSIYFQQNMQPYIIKDGGYWVPAGPGFIPRGYHLTPNFLYPRGFHPPLMMPRIPMMNPFRHSIYRSRMQAVSNVTSTATSDSKTTINCQKEVEQNVEKCDIENPNNLQLLEEPITKVSSVTIDEICSEKEKSVEKC